ncbi:alanine racemase [Agromyces mediolanus]|uniref:alanine racemase n=1 Tax=Agromyces mediolanus TaxID=41986 RepID=UPI001E56A3E3|nr:alanine racemase [Agromyces mediolanus]MCD1572857.1 alanine racemase [Agromyces mediolanus]
MTLALDRLHDELLTPADTGLPARAAGLTARAFLATEPTLDEFWTPLTVLDRAALEHNATTVQRWASEAGLELMPHGKTTMAPQLWALQLDRGASGLTLATPGQLRTARAFGADRLMLANALVAPAALAWLAGELADPGFRFHCWVDSIETVEAMERGLATLPPLPRPIEVLVELGGTGGRTGARSLADALALARRVAASPVLRLAGVAGYEGALAHDRSAAGLDAVRDYLGAMLELRDGLAELVDDAAPLIVTAGGSAYPDLVAEVFAPAIAAATASARPGRWILRSGASLVHDDGFYHGISPLDAELVPAMRGYARVVSHPEPGLALLDGGRRDFPFDEGLPRPLAVSAELRDAATRPLPTAEISAVNDQHAFLRGEALPVRVGEVVALGLSHPCTAFDKRRWLPVVERAGSARVVDLVRTFF